MTCPHCAGKGVVPFITVHRSGHVACRLCAGSGETSEAQIARLAAGKELRERRVTLGFPQREVAEAIGIPPSLISQFEYGQCHDDPSFDVYSRTLHVLGLMADVATAYRGPHPRCYVPGALRLLYRNGQDANEAVFVRVEDWADRVLGRCWSSKPHTPAALEYATHVYCRDLPRDQEVLYVKHKGLGYLVHVSELGKPVDEHKHPEVNSPN